jgi:hypothetical protein
MLQEALKLREQGLAVIPCGKNKKPLIPWMAYQDRQPTEDEIKLWWTRTPDANVAIITGKVSNLTVIDCDSSEAAGHFRSIYKGKTVTVKTPRGTHYYFTYQEGTRNTVKVGGIDLDVRSEGGYVIAPPSINGEGVAYKWLNDFSITSLDSFSLYRGDVDSTRKEVSTSVYKQENYFIKGRRDSDLFRTARALIKDNQPIDLTYNILKILADNCEPPFPANEIEAKLRSAIEQARRKEKNLAEEVKDFVLSTTGVFLSTECLQSLQLSTREEKKNLSIILKRLSLPPEPIIEKWGDKNGCWRRIEQETDFMDFMNVDMGNTLNIRLPMDIHKKTIFFPKAVIVVAGVTGTGKTLFALDTIRENQDHMDTYYFNSEMSPQALHKKLSYFNTPMDSWKFKAIPGETWDYKTIADKIFPDALNIIDYLEPEGEKPYAIHGSISAIINKLRNGAALITIQKKPGNQHGTGGIYSAKAASLYIGLEFGTLRIEKNRFREEDPNPKFTMLDFDVAAGSHFKVKGGGWYSEGQKKESDRNKSYVGVAEDAEFINEED